MASGGGEQKLFRLRSIALMKGVTASTRREAQYGSGTRKLHESHADTLGNSVAPVTLPPRPPRSLWVKSLCMPQMRTDGCNNDLACWFFSSEHLACVPSLLTKGVSAIARAPLTCRGGAAKKYAPLTVSLAPCHAPGKPLTVLTASADAKTLTICRPVAAKPARSQDHATFRSTKHSEAHHRP